MKAFLQIKTVVLLLLSASLTFENVFGQDADIPIGTWRMHISFNEIKAVAVGQNEVYAAAPNGVLMYHKVDQHIEVFHKGNGLNSTGIHTIGFDTHSKQLLIAYEDGTFDAIQDNKIRNIDPSRNTVLTGSKKINSININNSLAYLSTDYGVLVFDLMRREIKETWRDIGAQGATLKVFESTFYNDSIFLATESGVLAGNLNENLLDFNKWKVFDENGLGEKVNSISTFQNSVYAGVNGSGIFKYNEGNWEQENFLQNLTYTCLNSSADHLLIAESENVWLLNADGDLTKVNATSSTHVNDVRQDHLGRIWIGDRERGLMTNNTGTFQSIIPNGPTMDEVVDLLYFESKIYLLSGGFSPARLPLGRKGTINVFQNGAWASMESPVKDLTSLAFTATGTMYVASYGYGVEQKTEAASLIFDESNSTLVNINPPERSVQVTDLVVTTDGLWVTNYGANPSLHLLTDQNTWESFASPVLAGNFPVSITSDFRGNIWMILDPAQGGGLLVFNKKNNEYHHLTTTDNKGELPSNTVNAIQVDRNGDVWVGTNAGVAYFFDKRSDAIKPLFENRFLLRDDNVTAIAVDGGNRKWIGTERGVWLFNATGEEAIANFTKENSPLLSNNIIDIEINSISGEVFFATDKGLTSFRSNATASKPSFDKIKIFPNPVTPHFTGQVGISGLATDAIIKITDPSGRLVWETQANGGSASWDVRDHQGRRPTTGIFLVYAITPDGQQSIVGKIAIIN